MTWTGLPSPAGKWRASAASPVTASGLVRKESLLCRPLASSWVTPRAMTPSTTAVTIHTSRGRRAMRWPIPGPQAVLGRLGRADLWPRRGQNAAAHDDQQRRQQGDHGQQADRDADGLTGPRLLVELSSATSRVSRLRITVAALAMIAGVARPRATAMASWRSAWRRRLLPVAGRQQQRIVGAGTKTSTVRMKAVWALTVRPASRASR